MDLKAAQMGVTASFHIVHICSSLYAGGQSRLLIPSHLFYIVFSFEVKSNLHKMIG